MKKDAVNLATITILVQIIDKKQILD